ncbi:MAG: hypothetical protein HQL31_05815 [Planctomycetes bacterium]|nr:hypothetical protein [Planctomycetota bacterium]
MAREKYSSFRELLIKKNSSEESVIPGTAVPDYSSLVRIFTQVRREALERGVSDFCAEDRQQILAVLDRPEFREHPESHSESRLVESVRSGLKNLSDNKKVLLTSILGTESLRAEQENKKIQRLAEKYQPLDPGEKIAELNTRIKSIREEVMEMELSMMDLERNDNSNSAAYNKKKLLREKRLQTIVKLQKDIKSLEASASRDKRPSKAKAGGRASS